MTSSVPPAILNPGMVTTISPQAYMPHSPVSAVALMPARREPSAVIARIASVLASLNTDSAGPGGRPASRRSSAACD